MLNIQLKLMEREKDNWLAISNQEQNNNNINNNDISKLSNEYQMKIIRLKLQINNEEESIQKRLLNNLKETIGMNSREAVVLEAAGDFGDEFIMELKMVYKVDLEYYLKSEAREGKDAEEDEAKVNDDYDDGDDDIEDESKFFDAYEDTESIKKEEDRLKQIKVGEMNAIKKKILAIGSKKSSLRLNLVKSILTIKKLMTYLNIEL